MIDFKNILLVLGPDHILNLEQETLDHLTSFPALQSLDIFILTGTIPEPMRHIQDGFTTFAREKLDRILMTMPPSCKTDIRFLSDHIHSAYLEINRRVAEAQYDLVIKPREARPENKKARARAADISLIRKCPAPVWLTQVTPSQPAQTIAVAIDPLKETQENKQLNITLLKTAEYVARARDANLHVISCWQYEYEEFHRHSFPGRLPDEDIQALIDEEDKRHKTALDHTLDQAGLSRESCDIVRIKGAAEDQIPAYIKEHDIDMLIMGTLGRTGIKGFIIGNTAENILWSVDCDLLALKPEDFTSSL